VGVPGLQEELRRLEDLNRQQAALLLDHRDALRAQREGRLSQDKMIGPDKAGHDHGEGGGKIGPDEVWS
jgi:hypothetical protein